MKSKSLREFHRLARSIVKNSKGEVLLTALKRGFAEAQKKGAKKKAVIFTESTRTQSYLRDIEDANLYRVGHPLAHRIIDYCKKLPTPEAELAFNYSVTGRNIAALDPLAGKSGWLQLTQVSVTAFETEDHLIFSGLTDDGKELDELQCQRLFSLGRRKELRCQVPMPNRPAPERFFAARAAKDSHSLERKERGLLRAGTRQARSLGRGPAKLA